MNRHNALVQPELAHRLQGLIGRAAASRHIHSAVLGVQFDDGSIDVRVAAGAAEPTDAHFAFFVPELGCHIVGTLNALDNSSRAFNLMMKVAGTVGEVAE